MNKGNFSLFCIKKDESNPTLIGKTEEFLITETPTYLYRTDYINNEHKGIIAIEKKGSLYIKENEKERCVKKFYGSSSEKFTGYGPIGFSPDGKYLVYSSMEHLTAIGSIIDMFIRDFDSNVYIMNLETGKSTRFVNSYNIQWLMN